MRTSHASLLDLGMLATGTLGLVALQILVVLIAFGMAGYSRIRIGANGQTLPLSELSGDMFCAAFVMGGLHVLLWYLATVFS